MDGWCARDHRQRAQPVAEPLQARVDQAFQLRFADSGVLQKQQAMDQKVRGFRFPVVIALAQQHADLVHMVFH